MLPDGREAACKLQYPDMASAVEADLRQLKLIFAIYERYDKAVKTGQIHAEIAARLREELARFSMGLVVNDARTEEEFALAGSMVEACRRYMGIRLHHLATIPHEDAVWQSVRKRKAFILEAPD